MDSLQVLDFDISMLSGGSLPWDLDQDYSVLPNDAFNKSFGFASEPISSADLSSIFQQSNWVPAGSPLIEIEEHGNEEDVDLMRAFMPRQIVTTEMPRPASPPLALPQSMILSKVVLDAVEVVPPEEDQLQRILSIQSGRVYSSGESRLSCKTDTEPVHQEITTPVKRGRPSKKTAKPKTTGNWYKIKVGEMEAQVAELIAQAKNLEVECETTKLYNSSLEMIVNRAEIEPDVNFRMESSRIIRQPCGSSALASVQSTDWWDTEDFTVMDYKDRGPEILHMHYVNLHSVISQVFQAMKENQSTTCMMHFHNLLGVHKRRFGNIIYRVSSANPSATVALTSFNQESCQPENPPDGMWHYVLNRIEFTDQQRQQIMLYNQEHCARQDKIDLEGIKLRQELEAGILSLPPHSPSPIQMLEKLGYYTRRQHEHQLKLCMFLFSQVMDVMQFSKAVFHSYPFVVDAGGIVKALVQQQSAKRLSSSTPKAAT